MYNLATFSLGDMSGCGAALRQMSAGAASMEEVSGRVVHYLYDHLIDQNSGERACALVRFYKSHPFGGLDESLQSFARKQLGTHPESPAMACLTLLSTAGIKPEWNSRAKSVGHQAIPLPSPKIVAQAPMIAGLIKQLGLEIHTLLNSDPNLLVELEQRYYNVFHVADAVGSSSIPAQDDFVIPFSVRSVLGFGGMLPSGNLFAVILFSKIRIARENG